MKTKKLILSLVVLCCAQVAFAQGPAFTYQGRLTDGGTPANGSYDFWFQLYSASNGGVAGPFATAIATPVSNGLFTVLLSMGPFIDDSPRWLEIGVRTNGAVAFTNLAARQRLTPAPLSFYASLANQANLATSAASLSGSLPASQVTGTLPFALLPAGVLTNNASGVTLSGTFIGNGVGLSNLNLSAANIAPGSITSAMLAPNAVTGISSPDGSPLNVLNVNTNGYVGVGTTNPTAALSLTGGPTQIVPRVLAQIQDGFGSFTNLGVVASVAVKGDLLAVGASSDDAVTLVNIANPTSPVRAGLLLDGVGGFTNLNEVASVAFSGTSNLLAIASSGDHAVTLVDVNNPASPVKRAELRDGVGAFLELNGARAVAFSSNLLAIAAFNDNAVTLVDVSNPATPVFRIAMKDGQFGFNDLNGAYHVALSGNLLAIAGSADAAVTLVDVSNPASPILRAVLKNGVGGYDGLAQPYAVAFSGNLLAICSYYGAVTLVDVSNPASPILRSVLKHNIGGFDYLDSANGVTFSGNLLAISSYFGDAVTLVDVSDPASPQLRGVSRNGVGGAHLLVGPSSVAFAGTNMVVGAYSAGAFTILSPEVQTMGLSSAGWVGIGVGAPQAALHVQGDVLVEGDRFTVVATRVQIGSSVTASGGGSTAMGYYTTASGGYSTAMGSSTTASGNTSTAMGSSTTASGNTSTALGAGTTASGVVSTAIGYYTTASGTYSTAMGFDSTASGDFSTAMGINSTASGGSSTAMGIDTTASGFRSTAMGSLTTASGLASTAMGSGTTASSNYSTAMGANTVARGDYATAMGQFSDASGDWATAMSDSTASGNYSVSSGFHSVAGGIYSVALGYVSTASGIASTALGDGCVASGNPSVAMLGNSTAAGDYTVAIGRLSEANAHYSFALGRRAKAEHVGAFVWGDGSNSDVASIGNNSVTMRAAGGYRLYSNSTTNAGVSVAAGGTSWAVISDRNVKKDFAPVDALAILEKLAGLPITQWHYNWETSETTPHIGPMAQDFKAAFYPGSDDKSITTLEADGVALAAIQGLNQKFEEREALLRSELKRRDAENAELKQRLEKLERMMNEKNGGAE